MSLEEFKHRVLSWLPLVLGIALAFTFLEYTRSHLLIKLDEVALGTETASVLSHDINDNIQCMDIRDHRSCVDTYKKSNSIPTLVWLGNSQLHAINRFKKGQKNAPPLLHKTLLKRGYFLVTYSQPNANIYEHAIVFNGIFNEYRPKLLILPLVFDDFREFGIRETVADFVKNTPVHQRITSTRYWDIVKPMLVDTQIKDEKKPLVSVTLQEEVESWLTNELSSHSLLWESRPTLRGNVASAVHKIRNKILGIHSYSKRHLDPGVYKERMHFLSLFIADVKAQGTDLLVYIPPYRDDIEGPYVNSEYAQFKKDVKQLVDLHDGYYSDFEKEVQGSEWGIVTDHIFGFEEPDFMHFTAAGHKKLANAISNKLKEVDY